MKTRVLCIARFLMLAGMSCAIVLLASRKAEQNPPTFGHAGMDFNHDTLPPMPIGLCAIARALTDKVRIGEAFKVELRLENRTTTTQFLDVKRSWFPRWRSDTLEVSIVKWDWKDEETTAAIDAGAAKVNIVEMMIPRITPHRRHSFRMGFAQSAEPNGEPSNWWEVATAWSNEVSVEVAASDVGPLAIGRAAADFDHDGRADELSLLWLEGRHFDDEDLWCGMGEKFEGKFAFRVAFADGRVVDTPLEAMGPDLSEGIWFRSCDKDRPHAIVTADYNHNGNIDFNVGQYGGCNGSNFYLFEILPSGKIGRLSAAWFDEGRIYSSGHEISEDFELTETGFAFGYYDSSRGRGVSCRAEWDTKLRRFHVIEEPPEKSP